jgi:hypothetical protein
MCRRGRNDAFLHETTDPDFQQLAKILHPQKADPSQPLDSATVAEIIAKGEKLSEKNYNMLWIYLCLTGQLWYPYNAIRPEGALVLPPNAKHPSEFHHDGDTFSCHRSHYANSSIQFYTSNRTTNIGFIEAIWQIPLKGHMHTFLLVRPHHPLPPEEEQKAPFHQCP